MYKLEPTYRAILPESGVSPAERIAVISLLVHYIMNNPTPEQRALKLEPKE